VDTFSRSFFERDATIVARSLLGKRLVRTENGNRMSGIITETEAYHGETDLGCHAHVGRTPRNSVMFGAAGQAYIYFTYGMHWCLNVVCMSEGFPAAVLLRAIKPFEGQEIMRVHRPNLADTPHWTDGPAKLTQALGIDRRLNETDLLDSHGELMIEPADEIPQDAVLSGPRIGLFSVPEPWKSIPWRFWYNYPTR